MTKLEKYATSTPPLSVDVTLVDGMFHMNSLQNIPETYGEVAAYIIKELCRKSKWINFICDTYTSPSIKDLERIRREEEDEPTYCIT